MNWERVLVWLVVALLGVSLRRVLVLVAGVLCLVCEVLFSLFVSVALWVGVECRDYCGGEDC